MSVEEVKAAGKDPRAFLLRVAKKTLSREKLLKPLLSPYLAKVGLTYADVEAVLSDETDSVDEVVAAAKDPQAFLLGVAAKLEPAKKKKVSHGHARTRRAHARAHGRAGDGGDSRSR